MWAVRPAAFQLAQRLRAADDFFLMREAMERFDRLDLARADVVADVAREVIASDGGRSAARLGAAC